MNLIKFNLTIFQSLAIALLIPSVNFPQRLLAEKTHIVSQSNNDEITIRFIPANSNHENNTPPPETSDAPGTRGDCIAKQPPMTRLVGRESLHLTVSSHPTFWVYVPYTAEEAPSGVFSLKDEAGDNIIWKTDFQLPNNEPGIVSITLPSNIALEVDTTYQWFFKLNCPTKNTSNENSTPAVIFGLVKRESYPHLERELNNVSTALERVEIYAENGIWYNAIAELANLRLGDRENSSLEQVWVDFLNSQGLEKIAEEPIVGNVIILSPVDRPE